MIINQITITAEASRAYQKYCVSLTAQELQEGDIEFLKNMAISEAVKGIDELAGCVEVKPEIKVTQQPIQPKQQYQAPRTPVQQPKGFVGGAVPQHYHQPGKPVSEAQIKYLQGLGYKGEMPKTWDDADQLLKILKSQRG